MNDLDFACLETNHFETELGRESIAGFAFVKDSTRAWSSSPKACSISSTSDTSSSSSAPSSSEPALSSGVNSDESARELKGPGRPIVSHYDRLAIIQALRCVDEAHVFHELTPAELIERLNRDLVVKGGDYRADQVVSCRRRVAIIPFVSGYSTSEILKRIVAPS
jgi:glycerol-3-phosphate cytidylyltransferase-like family protein